LAFDVRIGTEDDLLHALVLEATQQLLDAELVGTDAFDRTDRTLEHVVAASVLTGPLDGHDVPWFLDHTHDRTVTSVVGADLAEGLPASFGDVEAQRAEGDLVLGVGDRTGESSRVLAGQLEQIERDALRRLRTDARQPAQLVDQVLDGSGVDRHQSSPASPGGSSPGTSPGIAAPALGPPRSIPPSAPTASC